MSRKIIQGYKSPENTPQPEDFKELLNKYESLGSNASSGKSIFSQRILWSATTAAAVLLAVFILWPEDEKSENLASKKETKTELTDLKPEESPSWSLKISPDSAQILISPNGTIIEISGSSFSLPNGKTPSSELEIILTELNDPVAIMKSKTSMSYDSAGTKYHFQTDGMFGLEVISNEGDISLEKELTIHYPQTIGRSNSNTYFMANDTWSYLETTPVISYDEVCEKTIYRFNENSESKEIIETAEKITSLETHNAALVASISSLESSIPTEPKKQNLNNYRFHLDIDQNEFPELAEFSEVLFEVKDSRFTWDMYSETWNDVKLEPGTKEGRYLITLKNQKRVEIFDVYPVLSESEFKRAFTTYSNNIRTLEEQKLSLQAELERNKEIISKFEKDLAAQKKSDQQRNYRRNIKNHLVANLDKTTPYRSVSIGQLGKVNFDIAIPLPSKGVNIPAEFYIVGNSTTVKAVSMIEVNNSSYFNFKEHEFVDFRVLTGKSDLILSVLADGSLAYFHPYSAKSEFKRGNQYRFMLKPTLANTLEELKAEIGLKELADL